MESPDAVKRLLLRNARILRKKSFRSVCRLHVSSEQLRIHLRSRKSCTQFAARLLEQQENHWKVFQRYDLFYVFHSMNLSADNRSMADPTGNIIKNDLRRSVIMLYK